MKSYKKHFCQTQVSVSEKSSRGGGGGGGPAMVGGGRCGGGKAPFWGTFCTKRGPKFFEYALIRVQ